MGVEKTSDHVEGTLYIHVLAYCSCGIVYWHVLF